MFMNPEEIANRLINREGIYMKENEEQIRVLVQRYPKEALRELLNKRMFYTYSFIEDRYKRLKERRFGKLKELERLIEDQEKFDITFSAILEADRCGEIYRVEEVWK